MSGDTKILYWSDRYHTYETSPIKDLYYRKSEGDKKFKVLSNGKEVTCRVNKFDIPAEYEIHLVNGAVLKTTANHLNKVYGKDFTETRNLTTDDYLPYSLNPFYGNNEMTYEDGRLVGMFLGDGSYRNSHEVVFSLNEETKSESIEFIKDYCSKHYGATITESKCISQITNEESCVNIAVNSDFVGGLIKQFVLGDSALTKSLNGRVFSCSMDFRLGVLEGLYEADGDDNNRICTSSKDLRDSLITILATMGVVTTVSEDRLGENTNYIIKWYTPNGETQRENEYIIQDGYFWVKIESISKLENAPTSSYCLEVIDGSEPVFMLANGIHTHNCRLLSDTSKLNAFINSIGGTALSIGSIKVNTINLMRIALETHCDKNEYLKLLRERATLCCKALDRVRHIIKRNVEKGLLPNYQDGAVEMDKQYNTMGILGLYEVIEAFGFTTKDEFGYINYTDEGIDFASQIFDVLNDVKDNFTDKYSINIESVPRFVGTKVR